MSPIRRAYRRNRNMLGLRGWAAGVGAVGSTHPLKAIAAAWCARKRIAVLPF